MREVYIQFTKPGTYFPILSWLIRLIEKTPYSHVRLKWTNTTGRELIYEASGTNVRFIGPLAQEQNKAIVVKEYCILLTNEEYRDLIDTCIDFANLRYSKLQLVGIGLSKLFNLNINPFKNGKKYQICTELVVRVLQRTKNYSISNNLHLVGLKEIDKFLLSLTNSES